jgi:hypothetical protein
VRQWSIRAAGDGFLYFYDDSGGALRFYCETSGRVVFNNGIYSATTLQVIGVSTLSTVNCGAINTQNNNLTMGTGDITCQTITTSGNITTSVGGTTAIHGLVNSWRNWSMRCLATSGQFDIADNSAGVQRLVIDLSGTVTILQSCVVGANLAVNSGVIDVGSTGIGYTGLAAVRYAFSSSGRALNFYVGGTNTGTWTFNAPSDEKIKRNIGAVEGDALEELLALKLISYDLIRGPEAHYRCGFSANQMQPIIPEAVVEAPMGDIGDEGDETMLVLDVVPLIARLVGAVQQLTRRLETLEGARR